MRPLHFLRLPEQLRERDLNAKRLLKHLPFLLAALLPAWAIGQIFRDEEWITALVFYIPSPILGGIFLLAALISAFRRNFGHTTVFLALSLAPLIVTICIENQFLPVRENRTPELKIVHWNVARGQLGIDRVLSEIEDLNADFYFLSEAPNSFDSLNGLHSLRARHDAGTFRDAGRVGTRPFGRRRPQLPDQVWLAAAEDASHVRRRSFEHLLPSTSGPYQRRR